MLDKIITFDWKVALLRRMLSDDMLKNQVEIIHGKYEDNYFVKNPMGKLVRYLQG